MPWRTGGFPPAACPSGPGYRGPSGSRRQPVPVPPSHPNASASTHAGPNTQQADILDVDNSHDESDDQLIDDTTNIDSTIHIPDLPLPTTRSGRVSKPIFRYGIGSVGDYGIEDVIMALIGNEAEPTTYKQAVSCRHADQWKEAMNKEIASMSGQDVFQLVPRTKDMNVIKSRWVYKIKTDASNLPTVWKARLVAKGFLQVYGVDYVETFAPVVRYKSIRMILVLASQYGLVIHQIDYKTAFLNATLTESIYMEQPTGYSTGSDYVWKLNKAIYGLKQSPMEWNHEIDSTLRTLGYNPTVSDPCVYIKLVPNYPPIILALYVDDTIIAIHPDLMDQWEQDRQAIAAAYSITDLGICRWILNMELMVTPDPVTGKCIYTLSQHPYIIKLLDKFNMTDCNPVQALTLFANLSDPKQDQGHALTMDQHSLYRQIVGAVLYLANTTRMDISYAVS